MQIYSPTLKGPLKVSGFIDPDDVTDIHVFWNARVFSPLTVYRFGDITRPSEDNGYYYQCTINGVTGASEPDWGQEETVSGTVTFVAIPWNLWLLPDDEITSATWVASNNAITLSNQIDETYESKIQVSTVPKGLSEFTLTVQVEKTNGESLSRSFVYKVNEQ